MPGKTLGKVSRYFDKAVALSPVFGEIARVSTWPELVPGGQHVVIDALIPPGLQVGIVPPD